MFRTIARTVVGAVLALLGLTACLLAAALWAADVGPLGAGSAGLLGLVLLGAGLKRLRPGPAPRKYHGYRWGEPPPTTKQFGYAMHLGITLRNGMTKWDVSAAIDDVLGKHGDY